MKIQQMNNINENYLYSDNNVDNNKRFDEKIPEDTMNVLTDLYISKEGFEKYKNEYNKHYAEAMENFGSANEMNREYYWRQKMFQKENSIYKDMAKNKTAYGFADTISISTMVYWEMFQEIEDTYAKSENLSNLKKEDDIKYLNEAFEHVIGNHILALNSSEINEQALAYREKRNVKYNVDTKTRLADSDELRYIFHDIQNRLFYNAAKNINTQGSSYAKGIVMEELSKYSAFSEKMEYLYRDYYKSGWEYYNKH